MFLSFCFLTIAVAQKKTLQDVEQRQATYMHLGTTRVHQTHPALRTQSLGGSAWWMRTTAMQLFDDN